MKRDPEPLVLAWLFICLVVVVGGAAWRAAPVELAWVLPWPGGWPGAGHWLPPLATSLAVAATGLLLLGVRRAGPLGRLWAQTLLFFPVLFGYYWFVFPLANPGTLHWLGAAALLIVAVWLGLTGPEPGSPGHHPGGHIRAADLFLGAGPVVAGLLLQVSPDGRAVLYSLVLYPFYSLLQLTVFLLVPARRLAKLGVPDRSIAVTCAVLFALAHWPNPLVMPATFLAMFLWAGQFLRGRPLRELVLVMTIAATAFSQFLPDDLTRHMRVGPGFLRREALAELAVLGGQDICEPRGFLTAAYPLTVGRPIYLQELEDWLTVIHRSRRHGIAWQMFMSPEYARLAGRRGLDPPPDAEQHWIALPPFWRDRITQYGQDTYWENQGSNQEDFLSALYRDILGRERGPREGAGWTFNLTPGQRMRLAEILLASRSRWHREPFRTMSVREMALP